MARGLAIALCVALCVALVHADMYMMFPQGGNDRLDDQNRDRDNGNRLWDSQNNNRGGNNHGTFGREYYYEGSLLKIEWTSQHSCANPNNHCEFIVQYYCDNNITRDGIVSTTIPDVPNVAQCQPATQGGCDTDARWGRHESFDSYQDCKYRQRNMGLWTSTQDLQGNGAIYTRQNPNGNRHGYECPEERDYYPYWHPTTWRDIAIFTLDSARCAAWQAESQNVKDKYYCNAPAYVAQMTGGNPNTDNGQRGFVPITQAACEAAPVKGTWTKVAAWGIPEPICAASNWTRDNHLGNTIGGETPSFLWQVPLNYVGESCVFRMRYNISTGETRWDGYQDYDGDSSVQCGWLNYTLNYKRMNPPNGIQIDDNNDNVTPQNPKYFKYCDGLDVWTKYGFQWADIQSSFNVVEFYQADVPTRGYVFRNDPVVDIFGPLVAGGVQILFRLAFDTSQFGRTFQDRSHTFTIRPMPAALAASTGKVWNLGVRGKRGNIVQNYPGVEYDFVPNDLFLNQGDWIHFQWQGSNFNPQNNAGQGTAGTDRSNFVELASYSLPYTVNGVAAHFPGPMDMLYPFPKNTLPIPDPTANTADWINGKTLFFNNWKMSYPGRIDTGFNPAGVGDTAQNGGAFLGFSQSDLKNLAVPGILSPYFDYGPIMVKTPGVFCYLSTRNNAFTNRGQKAIIWVKATTGFQAAEQSVSSVSVAQLISPQGTSWIRYAPDPNGFTTNSQIQITELGDNRIMITPFLFDVIPGQMVMLDWSYTTRPLTNFYVYQSDYSYDQGNQMKTNSNSGVATVQITRGGYYKLYPQVSSSAVAGVVIGVLTFIGLAGFGYYKLNQKFHFRDKKYIAAQTTTAATA